jgi:hypothetical protein
MIALSERGSKGSARRSGRVRREHLPVERRREAVVLTSISAYRAPEIALKCEVIGCAGPWSSSRAGAVP